MSWWPRPPTPPTAVVDPSPMTANTDRVVGAESERARRRASAAASPAPARPSSNLSESSGVGSVSYRCSRKVARHRDFAGRNFWHDLIPSRRGRVVRSSRAMCGAGLRGSRAGKTEGKSWKRPPVIATATELPITTESDRSRNSETIRASRGVFITRRTRGSVGSTAAGSSVAVDPPAGDDGEFSAPAWNRE